MSEELLIAAKMGDNKKLNEILSRNSSSILNLLNFQDESGNSALSLAAVNGHYDCVFTLLFYRMPLPKQNFTYKNGITPLLSMASAPEFTEEHERIAILLINFGFKASDLDNNERSALHLAADSNNIDALDFFLKQGLAINEGDTNGKTPLMICAQKDGAALIEQSDEINDTIEYLLKHKANIHAKDTKGNTALMYAAHADLQNHDSNLVLSVMKTLVNFGKANIRDKSFNGATPIMLVGCIQQIEFLVDKGANIYTVDKHGFNLAFYALRKEAKCVIQYLAKHYPELLDHRDRNNNSLLMLSYLASTKFYLHYLLANGAYIQEADVNHLRNFLSNAPKPDHKLLAERNERFETVEAAFQLLKLSKLKPDDPFFKLFPYDSIIPNLIKKTSGSLNARDKETKRTALYWAVANKNYRLVQLLICGSKELKASENFAPLECFKKDNKVGETLFSLVNDGEYIRDNTETSLEIRKLLNDYLREMGLYIGQDSKDSKDSKEYAFALNPPAASLHPKANPNSTPNSKESTASDKRETEQSSLTVRLNPSSPLLTNSGSPISSSSSSSSSLSLSPHSNPGLESRLSHDNKGGRVSFGNQDDATFHSFSMPVLNSSSYKYTAFEEFEEIEFEYPWVTYSKEDPIHIKLREMAKNNPLEESAQKKGQGQTQQGLKSQLKKPQQSTKKRPERMKPKVDKEISQKIAHILQTLVNTPPKVSSEPENDQMFQPKNEQILIPQAIQIADIVMSDPSVKAELPSVKPISAGTSEASSAMDLSDKDGLPASFNPIAIPVSSSDPEPSSSSSSSSSSSFSPINSVFSSFQERKVLADISPKVNNNPLLNSHTNTNKANIPLTRLAKRKIDATLGTPLLVQFKQTKSNKGQRPTENNSDSSTRKLKSGSKENFCPSFPRFKESGEQPSKKRKFSQKKRGKS